MPDRAVAQQLPRVRAPATWQALHYLYNPERFFTQAHRRHGDIFTIQMLGEEWIVLAHPDAVTDAFSHGPDELNSGEPLQVLRPVIGTHNLLLLDGEEHLHRRRIVLPPFRGDRMRAYEPTIRQAITNELSTWPIGKPFPVLPRTEALAFSTILSCVFGLQEKERMSTLATSLLGMLRWITDPRRLLVLFIAGPKRLMSLPRFRRQMQKIDHEVLAEITRRRTLKDLSQREDILSLLIRARDENDTGLSDTELRDELLTLLVAGHQNTAALLAWAIHELARDQHSQERLVAEPEIFADAVITETLRLRPSVPLVVRRLRKPLTIAGHQLPAGANLGPCALLVHRRADLYPQPLTFKPARFLNRCPSSSEWFPFGGPVRRCIGASFAQFEARIILEEITRTLHSHPSTPNPRKPNPARSS
jgi:cytochrome P450 family 135